MRAQAVIVDLVGQAARPVVGFDRRVVLTFFLAQQATQNLEVELSAVDLVPAAAETALVLEQHAAPLAE